MTVTDLEQSQLAEVIDRMRQRQRDDPLDIQEDDPPAGPLDDESAGLLDNLRTGDWLDCQEFPPLRWAIPGVVPEGTALLAGAPKTGKSWLVLGTALAVALGGVALGALPVGEGRPVLYLALEDSDRRMQKRCRVLLGDDQPIPANLHYMTSVQPGTCVATIQEWLGKYGQNKPLVVVDTLGKVMPSSRAGETAYQRDYRTIGVLQEAVREHAGATVIIVHHTRKMESQDFGDLISGTQGLLGAADTGLVLRRSRTEQSGILSVTGRDVEDAEYGLVLDGGAWRLDGMDLAAAQGKVTEQQATANLGDRSVDIYLLVKQNPGVGPTAVAQKLGMKAGDAGNYLARLVSSGRLVKEGRGRYYVSTDSTPPSDRVEDGDPVDPESTVETVESVEMPGQQVSTRPGWPRCECGNDIYDHGRTICGRCLARQQGSR